MRIWQDLHRHRQTGGMAPSGLTWPDFHAYCAITGEVLGRSDIEALGIIDGEFFASLRAAEDRRTKVKESRKG